MIVYAVFASLGLRGKVRPVLARSYHTREGVQYDSEDEADRYDPPDSGEEGEYEKEADPGKPMKLVPNHLYQTMVTEFGKSCGDAVAWEVSPGSPNLRYDIHRCVVKRSRIQHGIPRREVIFTGSMRPGLSSWLWYIWRYVSAIFFEWTLIISVSVRKSDVHCMEVFGGSNPYRCPFFCGQRLYLK